MNETITVESIQAMTDEERAQLHKQAVRHFAKFVLVKVATTAAVAVAVHFVVKALDARDETLAIETPQD